jgi:hypothetical protein
VDRAGHDAELAFARRDEARAVRPDPPRAALADVFARVRATSSAGIPSVMQTMSFTPSAAASSIASAPTSRKFAGAPPWSRRRSIVAIASPAPLTMQPMLPSRPT